MAQTVYLNDGSCEVVLEDEQTFLKRLIHEKLGKDVAEMFDSILVEPAYGGDNYEEIADGYHAMLLDTLEEINDILKYAKGSYTKKETLVNKLQNCKDRLYHNL